MRSLLLLIFVVSTLTLVGQKQYEFDFTGNSLYEAVELLSKKHKFKFSYSPKALKQHSLDRKIRANSDAELISKLFEDMPFKIQLSDGVYLLIPQKIPKKSFTLTGKVYDKSTGKPLAFAHVQSSERGTVSNQDGRFILPPREDTITLQVSYIGYKDILLAVPPNQEEINLNLEQNPLVLQEVILSTSHFRDLAGRPGFFSLNPQKFNALPTLGETDVFKSIQLLPGVSATDETSSGLSVRGSLPSQNLVLMDGFTLYHLDHFFGIFSTLNPNVIDNVSIYKGGFGAEYGGRVSSVVDVSGKAGSNDKFSAGAGVNMLSINGFIETPIGEKTSLLVGGRRSFTDLINSDLYQNFLTSNRKSFLTAVDPNVASLNLLPSFHFYDFNTKLRHTFNSKASLDVNLYLSEDSYSGDYSDEDDFARYNVTDKANWANKGFSLGLRKQFQPNWFGDFTLSASSYSDDESLKVSQTIFEDVSFGNDSIFANSKIDFFDYTVESSVSDIRLSTSHEIQLDHQNFLKAGVELNRISTFYSSDQVFFQDFNTSNVLSDTLDVTAAILSFYGNYQFGSERLSSNIGIRGNYYEPTRKIYIEPRFDIRFKVGENVSLKGAASYHHQFVNETSFSLFQNTDQFYWVLADEEIIPIQKASHFIIGTDYSFGNWTLDVEYYKKLTTGIIENQFLTLSTDGIGITEDEDLSLAGENNAQGLDLFLKYRTSTFTSWLSYSLGESNNQFWYRNDNTPYPSEYDQRHEINFVNTIKFGKWELSAILLYGSGKPFTPPNSDPLGSSPYDLERVNELRLPDYSRLDLSAKYSFDIGAFKCESGITLFNVFDKINIKSRRYSQQYVFSENTTNTTGSDEIRIVALDTYLLGFTPNFFFNLRF
ncbi:MAG: carboxypeptidase-like regulatory domain-containing protein [Cyclobacteriaceae bacterium]